MLHNLVGRDDHTTCLQEGGELLYVGQGHPVPFHRPAMFVWAKTRSSMRRATTGGSMPSTIRSSNSPSNAAGAIVSAYRRMTARHSVASAAWVSTIERNSTARLQRAWVMACHHCAVFVLDKPSQSWQKHIHSTGGASRVGQSRAITTPP